MIWKFPPDLVQINKIRNNTLVGHIDINFIEVGDDFLRATMPVDSRTHQPYGLLHGGASVVLAETIGSTASMLCLDPKVNAAVGLEINANHVRGVTGGLVTGTVRPLHIGRSTHVWDIRIENEDAKLVCVSRLTVAVIPARPLA